MARFYYGDGDAGQVSEGTARTDADGSLSFDLPADLQEYAQSQSWTLEAEIEDINNQVVSNRVSVPIHRGEFYIGLAPASYIGGINKTETINLITVNARAAAPDRYSVSGQLVQRTRITQRLFSVDY